MFGLSMGRFLSRPLNLLIPSSFDRLKSPSRGSKSIPVAQPFFLNVIRFLIIFLFIFLVIFKYLQLLLLLFSMFSSFFILGQIFYPSTSAPKESSTLGFSHIYVVVANPDRGRYVDAILKYHNLRYEAFPAITRDSDLVNSTVSSMWEKNQGKDDPKIWGKIGCWASHRAVWNDAIEKKYQNFLVLEDDIDVDLDLPKISLAGWEVLPSRWDFYFLGTCFASYQDNWARGPLKKLSGMACTHGYGVNSHIIPKLLEWSNDPPLGGIDLQVMTGPLHDGVVEAYGVFPPVIVQRPLALQHPSAIGNEEEPTFLEGGSHLMQGDWRINDVLPRKHSTAERLSLAYWYE